MKGKCFGRVVFAFMCLASVLAFCEDEEPSTYTLTASRQWVRKTVDKAKNELSTSFNAKTDKMTEDFKADTDGLSSALGNATNDLYETVGNATNDLRTAIRNVSDDLGKATNGFNSATNALDTAKRNTTDLRVWRRVCDTWHWKADFQTPQDFLDFANAYNAPQLVYHAEDGGEWGNVNMFWPNGKPKYLITLHAYPEDSLTNRFHFSVYDQTGTNQVSYFYAVASRASATNTYTYAIGGDSKTQPRGENEFVRVATTDVVYNWIQRDGADIAEKTVKTKIANAIKDIDPDAVTARELLDALLSIVGTP